MADDTSPIARALMARLDREGGDGVSEAVLVATTCKSVPGATPAAVQAALIGLVQRRVCTRKGGRVIGAPRATPSPRNPAELSALPSLRLPRLAASTIELRVDLPQVEEDAEADAAREAAIEANLAAAFAEVAPDEGGGRSLTLTKELFERMTAGVPPRRPSPLPSDAQVRAVAWLIENERAVALAIAEAFADRVRSGGRPRVGRSGDRDRDDTSFGVQSIRVRQAVGGRSTLVLDGWCGWDEEHGFGIELDGTDVIETGGASEIR